MIPVDKTGIRKNNSSKNNSDSLLKLSRHTQMDRKYNYNNNNNNNNNI